MGNIEFGEFVVGPQPHDDVLAYAYLTLKRAGLLNIIFYESIPDLQWFLQTYTVPGSTIGCWRKGPTSDAPATFLGMGLINKVERMGRFSKAEMGLAPMPGVSTIHEKIALGKACVRYAFDELGFDSLFGVTPEKNRAALAFTRRLGLKVHGPIKDYCVFNGELCGVYISQLSAPDATHHQ